MPKTLNGQMVDEWDRVSDAEAFRTARTLARREGLLVGGSSGTTVAVLADTWDRYLSRAWLPAGVGPVG